MYYAIMKTIEKKIIESALLPVPEVIVLPKTAVTFTLHDEKYIKMVEEVVSRKGLLAVAMTEKFKGPDGVELSDMLIPRPEAVLTVPTIIARNGDESITVGLQGLCRVRLLSILQSSPILTCKVEVHLTEEEDASNFNHPELIKMRTMLTQWINDKVENSSIKGELLSSMNNPENVVNYLCLFLLKDKEVKQLFLEIVSFREKFDTLSFFLNNKSKQKIDVQMLRDFIHQDKNKMAH